jgi:mannosyltransferase
MGPSSTDDTAVIIGVPIQPEPAGGTGPASWTPTPDDLPAPSEPLTNPRLTVLAWLVPVVAAGAIGLWGLGSPALSEDELATSGMVTAGWDEFRSVLSNVDVTVAPYYVLLRLWVALTGDADWLLRLPSVAFAAGAAGFVAAIGIRLSGRRVGLTAGLLFALLPGVSRYAQDARPYALVMLAAAASTYALLRLLDRRRWPAYLGYAATVAVLGLAHVVALLLLFAHGLVVARDGRSWRPFLAWLSAALAGVTLVLPLLLVGRRQSTDQIGWIPPLTWARLAETPERLFGTTVVAGAVMALALTAMSLRPPARVATLWAVVPAAGLALVGLVFPLWVPRYLLFVLPAWALLAALALHRLTVLRGLVAVLGIGLLAVPAHTTMRTGYGHDFASRDIALVIRANRLPGDAILFGPFAGGDQRTSRDAVMRYLATDERPADKLMVRPPRTRGSLGAQECADADIPSCFGKPDRVWVVRKGTYSNVLVNLGAPKEQLLRQEFVQSNMWPLKGFTVALYTRKPAA